jgi:ribosomal protein S18 acetylase RimI-like enzyme
MIRMLREEDAEAYTALRRASLADAPFAFAASPEDDVAASVDAVRERLRKAPEFVIVGAFEPELVGALGVGRDRHIKAAHKVHLWGMYVAPTHRRRGIAAAILQAALAHARTLPGGMRPLSVSARTPAAQHLYARRISDWGASRMHCAMPVKRWWNTT